MKMPLDINPLGELSTMSLFLTAIFPNLVRPCFLTPLGPMAHTFATPQGGVRDIPVKFCEMAWWIPD